MTASAAFVEAIEAAYPDCRPYRQLPEKRRVYFRRKFYLSKHKEKYREHFRRWVAKNRVRMNGYNRAYYAKNHAKLRRQYKQVHDAYRSRVLQRMGGCCACCGEREIAFLQIDHIVPAKHRVTSGGLLREVIRSHYDRTLFRVLCANCNIVTRRYVPCPHTRSEREAFWAACQRIGPLLHAAN